MPKLEGESFPSHEVSEEEMTILTTIDASRVRLFMNSLRYLLGHNLTDEDERLEHAALDNLSGNGQAKVDKFLEVGTGRELLWGGMTVEGLGVAFLGSGVVHQKRRMPEIGVLADPTSDVVVVNPATIWHGNADDGWDSGWDQHSYQTASWNGDPSFALYKPIEEWSASRNRGYYEISLLDDPHFFFNQELYAADVQFQQRSSHSGIFPTLGRRIIRTVDEDSGGIPAYQFNAQIQPGDKVFAMSHFLLDSYSSM